MTLHPVPHRGPGPRPRTDDAGRHHRQRALRRIKEAVYSALDGDLEQALETEARGQLQQSEDFFEGLSAFFMKREPDFKGR